MTRIVIQSAGVLIAGALFVGCGSKPEEETAAVATVDVAPVLLSRIQRTIRAEGVLYPRQQAAIVPKVVSPIKKVHVQRGTRVTTGQLLMELENADLSAAATENRATYEAAQATYETTSRATVPQDLQKAEVDARAAKDALDAQQALFDNRQRLFQEGAIAQKDVNDARTNLSQARAQYETAERRLQDLQAFGRDQALKVAAAERDSARSKDEAAQAQLSYSKIASPIDGVVTDLPFYAGETPASGQPIVTVMDTSRIVARAHISQAEASEVSVGNDANLIGADAVPIEGKVTQISPALDAASTTVEVWVEANNANGKLRPGSTLRVEIIAKSVPNTLVIPQAAVFTTPTGATFAMVIDNDNQPHRRRVTTGIRDSRMVQVTDGLESGQRVATTGGFELFNLEPDVLNKTKVQIAPAKEDEEPDET